MQCTGDVKTQVCRLRGHPRAAWYPGARGDRGNVLMLYDTMKGRKEPFLPDRDPVTIYVCGVTPYDVTHLGHAFTYVFYDVLVRYLRYRGYRTRYVQNVTDVDDDILRRARELGVPWDQLALEQTRLYQEDMAALNVLPPDLFPRASQEIPTIRTITQDLLAKGHAYRSNGNVYFRVDSYPAYGQLSHLPRDQMLPVANERGNDPSDTRKREPLDFVLWQESAPGEPRWETPWGAGRPGWHVECSAMALRYLGETIDIHGGGQDLVFPHHESEIAQSESHTGCRPFVRHWVHTSMVHLGGRKMSKSLGNLIRVRELLQRNRPNSLRLMLLGHRHTEPWEYAEEELNAAAALAELLSQAAEGAATESSPPPSESHESAAFQEAMDDDLDTPRAVAVLGELARGIVQGRRSITLAAARSRLRELASVLGLRVT